MLFSGHHVQALLIVLLRVGGLGLGIQFSALIKHLTTAVPAEYPADISGISTTALQIGAAIGGPRQTPGRESVAAGPHDSQRQGVCRT